MRQQLALRLLAEVMRWGPEELAAEGPRVAAMAAYKYDDYEQFTPAFRFTESLALWLKQFSEGERTTAYAFVMRDLVFWSATEMNHLVAMAYPDRIRPFLVRRAAPLARHEEWEINKVIQSDAFVRARRRTLFLGLSDGAHIDLFRRLNEGELENEQIFPIYEPSAERIDKLRESLSRKHHSQGFSTIVLLDDFVGSGKTYVRDQGGMFGGKVAAFHRSLVHAGSAGGRLVRANVGLAQSFREFVRVLRGAPGEDEVDILLVFYLATDQACVHLENSLAQLFRGSRFRCHLVPVHRLPAQLRINRDSDHPMRPLAERYYDPTIESESTRVGGSSDMRFGFSEGGLPLVLSHNTPNNSLFLLWATKGSVTPLFRRVQRYTE